MTNSNRSGGWFSSVVNNLSGFWSRPPDRSSHSGRRSMPIHSIEEQEDPEEEVNASSLRPSTSIPENTDRKRSPELSTVCDGICKKSYGTERVENMIREEDEEIAGLSCAFPRNSNRYLSPSVFSPMDSSRVTSDRNTMRKRVFSGISDGDQSTLNIFGKTFSSHIFDTVPNGNSSKRVKNDDWPRNSHSSNKNSQSLFLDRSSAFDTSTFGLLTSSTVESGRASSVLRSRISRPPSSTTSSLSSKTRAVLMELEKISTPVKEVRKLPMSSTIESWSRDETSLPPGAPPRKSLCSLSRAQVISNTLASSTRKPYWRRPAHARFLKAEGEKEKFGQHSEPKEDRLSKDVVDGSSKTLEETASDPASGDKADGHHSEQHNFVTMSHGTKYASTKSASDCKKRGIFKGFDGTNVKEICTNHFSARVPELEYDEGAENLADVDVALLKATKPLVMGENPLQPGFLGDTLFKFSSPVKRGPISITVKESEMKTDKHEEPEVADVEEKRGSGTDDSSEESEGEDVKDSTTELKKKTAASDSETSSSVSPAPVSTNGSPQHASRSCVVEEAAKLSTSKSGEVLERKRSAEDTSGSASEAGVLMSSESVKDWTCVGCMVPNKASDGKCACCGHCREVGKPWTCSECWVSNKADSGKCIACGHMRKSDSSAVSKAVRTISSSDKAWSCPDCFVKNEPGVLKCIACGHQPGRKSSSQLLTANVFGEKGFRPSTQSSGVTFGFGLDAANAKGTSSSVLVTSAPMTVGTSTFGFGLGMNNCSDPPSKSFTFGIASSNEDKMKADSNTKSVITPNSVSSSEEAPKTKSLPLFSFGAPLSTVSSTESSTSSTVKAPECSKPLFAQSVVSTPVTADLAADKPVASQSSGSFTSAFSVLSNPAPTVPIVSTSSLPAFISTPINSTQSETLKSQSLGPNNTPGSTGAIFGAFTASSTAASPFSFSSNTTSNATAPLFGSATQNLCGTSQNLISSTTQDGTAPTKLSFASSVDMSSPSASQSDVAPVSNNLFSFGNKAPFGSFGNSVATTASSCFGSVPTTTTPLTGLFGTSASVPTFGNMASSNSVNSLVPTGSFQFGSAPSNVVNPVAPQQLSTIPPLFSFGASNASNEPTTLGSSGAAFNFASNIPSNFQFGSHSTAPIGTSNFTAAASKTNTAFGIGGEGAPTTNFFNSGTSSSSGRRVLKAMRRRR